MRELRAVALGEDGGYLVLTDANGRTDGEQFRVPVDDRLRAALRGVRRSEVRTESALTPREIQARLRAGETAAEVARAAGIPVERVDRYEGPVLAERARVVQEARAALLPKDPGGVPGRPLGEAVDARLMGAQDNPAAAQWDAWRRVDGIWLVQLTSESRCARWTWDPVVRRVRPHDDAARTLVAPETAEQPAPVPAPSSLPSSVPSSSAALRAAGPALTLVHDQGIPAIPANPATPVQPMVAAVPEPGPPPGTPAPQHSLPERQYPLLPSHPAASYPGDTAGGGIAPESPESPARPEAIQAAEPQPVVADTRSADTRSVTPWSVPARSADPTAPGDPRSAERKAARAEDAESLDRPVRPEPIRGEVSRRTAATGRGVPGGRPRVGSASGTGRSGVNSRAAVAPAGPQPVTSTTSPTGTAAKPSVPGSAQVPPVAAVERGGTAPAEPEPSAPAAGTAARSAPAEPAAAAGTDAAAAAVTSAPAARAAGSGTGSTPGARRTAARREASAKAPSAQTEEAAPDGTDETTVDTSNASAASRARPSNTTRGSERPAGGRRGRKSVPAWDDIVFGARRP
ncbi:septation protein SepH [Frankia sp. CcWB3]